MEYNARMDTREKIERIRVMLRKNGDTGTNYRIARLLDVSPSTVGRWEQGLATPRGRQAEALELLFRTLSEAAKGDPEAKRILGALLGVAGASLLGLGLGGVLIAAGLGWILGTDETAKSKH